MEESWRALGGHLGSVWAVDWVRLSDGRLFLASGDSHGKVRIWDAASWECVRVLTGHEDAVASVRWVEPAGGGLLLATGDDIGIVRVWDADSWQCRQALVAGDAYRGQPAFFPLVRRLRRPPARLKRIRSLVWVEDGDGGLLLVTGSYDNTIRVWDAESWTCRLVVPAHANHVTAVAAARTRDGRALLASGGYDGEVRIWRVNPWLFLRVLPRDFGVISLAWATRRDGRLLLAAGLNRGQVRIWDADTWECTHVLDTAVAPALPDYAVIETTAAAWTHSPGSGGPLLLACANLYGRRVCVWDGERGLLLRAVDPVTAVDPPHRPDGHYVIALAWAEPTARDGFLRLAIGGGPTGRLCIWDVPLDQLSPGAQT